MSIKMAILHTLMSEKLNSLENKELTEALVSAKSLSIDEIQKKYHQDLKNPLWPYLIINKNTPEDLVNPDLKADCYIALAAFCYASDEKVTGAYKGVLKMADEARLYAEKHPECIAKIRSAFRPTPNKVSYSKEETKKLARINNFGDWIAYKLTKHAPENLSSYKSAWRLLGMQVGGPVADTAHVSVPSSSFMAQTPDVSISEITSGSKTPPSVFEQELSSNRESLAEVSLRSTPPQEDVEPTTETEFSIRKKTVEAWKNAQLQATDNKSVKKIIYVLAEIQESEIIFQAHLYELKNICETVLMPQRSKFLEQAPVLDVYLQELNLLIAASKDFALDKWLMTEQDGAFTPWNGVLEYLVFQMNNPFPKDSTATDSYDFEKYVYFSSALGIKAQQLQAIASLLGINNDPKVLTLPLVPFQRALKFPDFLGRIAGALTSASEVRLDDQICLNLSLAQERCKLIIAHNNERKGLVETLQQIVQELESFKPDQRDILRQLLMLNIDRLSQSDQAQELMAQVVKKLVQPFYPQEIKNLKDMIVNGRVTSNPELIKSCLDNPKLKTLGLVLRLIQSPAASAEESIQIYAEIVKTLLIAQELGKHDKYIPALTCILRAHVRAQENQAAQQAWLSQFGLTTEIGKKLEVKHNKLIKQEKEKKLSKQEKELSALWDKYYASNTQMLAIVQQRPAEIISGFNADQYAPSGTYDDSTDWSSDEEKSDDVEETTSKEIRQDQFLADADDDLNTFTDTEDGKELLDAAPESQQGNVDLIHQLQQQLASAEQHNRQWHDLYQEWQAQDAQNSAEIERLTAELSTQSQTVTLVPQSDVNDALQWDNEQLKHQITELQDRLTMMKADQDAQYAELVAWGNGLDKKSESDYQVFREWAQQQISEKEAALLQAQATIESNQVILAENENELSKERKITSQLRGDIVSLEETKNALTSQLERAKNKPVVMPKPTAVPTKESDRLKEELSQLNITLQETKVVLEDSQSAFSAQKAKLDLVNQEVINQQAEIEKLKEVNAQSQAAVSEARAQWEQQSSDLETELQETKSELTGLQQQLGEKERALEEKGKALQAEKAAVQEAKTAAQATEVTLKEQLNKQLEKQNQAHQAEIEKLKEANAQSQAAATEAKKQLEQKSSDLETELQETKSELTGLQQQLGEKERALKEKDTALQAAKTAEQEAKTAVQASEARLTGKFNTQLEEQNQAHQAEIEKLKEANAQSQAAVSEAQAQLEQQSSALQTQLQETKSELTGLQQQLGEKERELKEKDTALQAEKAAVQEAKTAAQESAARLTEQFNEQNEKQNQAHQAEMRDLEAKNDQQLAAVNEAQKQWEQQSSASQVELQQKTAQLETLQSTLNVQAGELEEKVSALQAAKTAEQQAKEAVQASEARLETALQEFTAEKEKLQGDVKKAQEQFTQDSSVLQIQLKETKLELADLQGQLASQAREFEERGLTHQAEILAFKTANDELKSKASDQDKVVQEYVSNEKSMREALSQLQTQVQKLTEENAQLRDKSVSDKMDVTQKAGELNTREAELQRKEAELQRREEALQIKEQQLAEALRESESSKVSQDEATQSVREIGVPRSQSSLRASEIQAAASVPVHTGSLSVISSDDFSEIAASNNSSASQDVSSTQPTPTPQQNQANNLGQELLNAITAQITTLQKEQKGFFAANKARKLQKIAVLNKLLELAKRNPDDFREQWRRYMSDDSTSATYVSARQGKMSARTRALLDQVQDRLKVLDKASSPTDANDHESKPDNTF